MAQVMLTQNPLPEEDQDERFIEFTKNVAQAFVELYLLKEKEEEGTIVGRSPEARGGKKPLVLGSEEDIQTATQDQIAYEVAQRLKSLGDQINSQLDLKEQVDQALKEFYQKQSIWEVGYNQFQGLLQGVLGSCQGIIRTGWDQVTVVYTLVARLVGELRVQQEGIGGLRESQMTGFAGTYMRDSGIQEWLQQQGGMDRITQTTSTAAGPPKVDIPETEV